MKSGRPTLAAQLLFRQGQADEPLHESGWLHLLEHLALHGQGGGALSVNGSVGILHTTFDAHGPHAAVTALLADVTRWLSQPTFQELERERKVLGAEADLRSGTSAGRAFTWRFGAVGPGMVGHAEPGLGRATPELLTERSRQVFNRRNAVLVLDGPPPADLSLTLPDGDLLRPAQAVVQEETIPAAYVDDSGLVMSGLVTRSIAATVAEGVLQRALHDQLRDRAGAAYAPWATYQPVDPTHALLIGGSDVTAAFLPELMHHALHLNFALRTEPVPEQWIDDIVAARIQTMSDPSFSAGLAARAAHRHLDGEEPQTREEVLAEQRAVRGDEVAAALQEFCASVLIGIPGRTTWRDEIRMLSYPEAPPRRQGTGYRSVDWPASVQRLHVSSERLELSASGVARSVDLTDPAGLLVFADGGRYVIGRDGWGLHVLPSAWRHGDEAVAALDRAVPSDLHLPQPARDGAFHQRLPAPKRWWLGAARSARSSLRTRTAPVLGLLLFAALVLAGLVRGQFVPVGGGIVGMSWMWRELQARRSADSQELTRPAPGPSV